jgi:hypothetical protein
MPRSGKINETMISIFIKYDFVLLPKALLLFILLYFSSNNAFAQQDSIRTDSTKLYENLETYSKRNRFTTFMYRLVFKPVATVSKNKIIDKKVYKKLIQKPYSSFEGKIIRNIDIITLDPFGYSVTDTTFSSGNFLHKAGNATHIKTQIVAIRNLLLIKRNKPFRSLLVKESERLIRSQKYVQEVSFYVSSGGRKSDSVDIFIRVKDKWSIVPAGSLSASGINIALTDKNFAGMGHEFQNIYSKNFTNRIGSFNTDYSIPGIGNTFISSKLHWGFDGYGNYIRSVSADRPFYSPVAKWAAGISFSSQSMKDSLKDINMVYVPLNHKFNTQDYWAGKAFRIFKGNTEAEQATNLIMTMRFLRLRYFEKPAELNDPLHIFSDENFYLTGIGISTRQYVQDNYIFNWGVVEDVPVGKVYGLTAGYQAKNNTGRFYLGMRFSSGNYHTWGYLSSNFEYGTFMKASNAEQGVISAGVNYFTPLLETGKWKFRQFVKPQITIGINRLSYDTLTLKDGYGLNGFNSFGLSGTNRLILTLQSQAYSPWNIAGFHFGPYINWSFGMLGDAENRFKNSRIYSQIGIGVLIKNMNLVFTNFQISFSFYPVIPGYGQNIFKVNSFRTNDFGFRDFEPGKPAPVIYR